MDQELFSVFPDSHVFSGSAVKGLHPFQKRPLQDLKNTLRPQHISRKPNVKVNLLHNPGKGGRLVENNSRTNCNDKVAPIFIHTDDNEPDLFWDPCNCCESNDNDLVRLPEDCLDREDFAYLSKGIFHLQNVYCEGEKRPTLYIDVTEDLDHFVNLSLPDCLPGVEPNLDLDLPLYLEFGAEE